MDLRVPMDPIIQAFGLSVTVTPPSEATIETHGVWLAPITEEIPLGAEFQRTNARRILALRRDEVPTVPRGTIIIAPEKAGDTYQKWRVEGVEVIDADYHSVSVIVVETYWNPDWHL
jgi:hypothetical protein